MNHLFLYQIIGVGLFTFGLYGVLRNRQRWAIVTFLQLMSSGVLLGFLTIIRARSEYQPVSELTVIFIFTVLAVEILLAIVFTYKVFISDFSSNSDDKPKRG
ncbi:MAG TPA: hypothetical protein P5268_04805 [Candidatus Marinimicrobia bacterium]|nr:hypothetical protein [Candidatus Neomarinimicrobiota bacterium]HRS51584.1 hypothetical protein [Candidatus Neomarinimicrobiota bacterium]HRU92338.1 hypothetical protein [Candidatus Neomarinimicrobiota bacterium]